MELRWPDSEMLDSYAGALGRGPAYGDSDELRFVVPLSEYSST